MNNSLSDSDDEGAATRMCHLDHGSLMQSNWLYTHEDLKSILKMSDGGRSLIISLADIGASCDAVLMQ